MNLTFFKTRPKIFTLIILFLTLASTIYWISRATLIISEDDNYKFSDNEFSGVRLSQEHDMRAPGGRIAGTVAYADFLDVATNFITTKKKDSFGFINQKNNFYDQNLQDLSNVTLKEGKIIPLTQGDQFFGIQSLTKFKLESGSSSLKKINNRWIKLRSKSKDERIAYLEKIDGDSIAWIRGDIPFDFFPSEIQILRTQNQSKPALFQLFTETTNAVRGGVVTTIKNNVVYLRHIPLISNIPIFGKFRYRPFVNETLILGTGEKYTIVKVLLVNGGFFLELDHSIKPYFSSNNDLVHIIPNQDKYFQSTILKISSETNTDYFFGRSRFVNLNINFSGDKPTKNDYITGTYGGSRYYVYSTSNDTVTIDLLESKVFNICNNIISKDQKYEEEIVMSERSIRSKFLNNSGSCKPGSVKNQVARQALIGLASSYEAKKDLNNILNNLSTRTHPNLFNDISIKEVFSRSLDMNLHYSCNLCGFSNPVNDHPSSLPSVFGKGDIWETYPGSLLNIYFGTLNPAVPELMIHALGKDLAEKYYKRFGIVQPSFVAFANPRQFTPWLYAWHWPFFEELLLNYKEFYSNSDFSLWYRPNNLWLKAGNSWDGKLNINNNKEFFLPIQSDEDLSVYTVSISYIVNNPLSSLPVIGGSPRLFITVGGAKTDFPARPPISLPLNDTVFTFPVFVQGKALPHLKVDLVDPLLSGTSFSVRSVSWRRVPVSSKDVANLLYYAPAFRSLANKSKITAYQ